MSWHSHTTASYPSEPVSKWLGVFPRKALSQDRGGYRKEEEHCQVSEGACVRDLSECLTGGERWTPVEGFSFRR